EEGSETFFKVLRSSIKHLKDLRILDSDEVMKYIDQLLEHDSGLSQQLQEFREECIAGCLLALDGRDRVAKMLEIWNRLNWNPEHKNIILLNAIEAMDMNEKNTDKDGSVLYNVLDA
ncbi:MAG: hypothetical protein N3A54_05665, partial [Patescibacteria group bacterium]|nr:hypothetical protein [Patescibacteria group bacterium]